MTGVLSKRYEPSRIRRGRTSTTPTWYVDVANGARWSFRRKFDAVHFIGNGCVCPNHRPMFCNACRGSRVREADCSGAAQ
jgi:hypothetical protein